MASITINIGGGTPNYTVEVLGYIGGPWIFTESGEQTITGSFLPGWYTVRVTDSNGCVAEDTQEICGTTTTSTTGLVSWEAEFTNHVCEQYECDIQYEILEVTFATTTTTTTTLLPCENSVCQTVLTAGTFIQEETNAYGYALGIAGSIDPNCENILGLMWNDTYQNLDLYSAICYDSSVVVQIDDQEFVLNSYSPPYIPDTYLYVCSSVPNPFPTVGEEYNIRICGIECTTTTTTLEPTTTTSTTSTSSTTTTTTLEPSTTTTTTTTIEPYDYCVEYGYLYNWYAATDVRNIAASGWHVPTDTEWTTLTDYLINNGYGYEGSGTDIAKSMAATTNWTSDSTPGAPGNDPASNNSSGFSGLPGGYRTGDGYFYDVGDYGTWWYSTEYSSSYAWCWSLAYYSANVSLTNDSKGLGFSVRCLRDSTTLSHGQSGTYTGNDGKVYRTICIGTQEWLADNLAETKYRNGDTIPTVTDGTTWAGLTTGAKCAYDNTESYVGYEGVCPTTTTTTTTTTEEPTTTTTTEELTTTTTVEPTTTTTTSTTVESTTTTTTTTLAEEDMSYCWWLHIPEADLTSGTDVLWAYRQIESQSNSWVRVIATSPVGGYAEACVCSVSAPLYGYAPIAGPAPSEPQDIVAIEETKTATHCTDDGTCSQCWETTTTTTIIT